MMAHLWSLFTSSISVVRLSNRNKKPEEGDNPDSGFLSASTIIAWPKYPW